MKKAIILLCIALGLVLLLGAFGSRQQLHNPNSESKGTPLVFVRGRIVEYEIIVASNSNDLAGNVNKKLKDKNNRWIPLGGISVNNGKSHQAMVKVVE